ncbi:hypothetical protein D3C87_2030340 [compost metagenome]
MPVKPATKAPKAALKAMKVPAVTAPWPGSAAAALAMRPKPLNRMRVLAIGSSSSKRLRRSWRRCARKFNPVKPL